MMRSGIATAILSPVAVTAGAALVAPLLIGEAMPWPQTLGLATLLCGSAGGLLLSTVYRRACRALSEKTRHLVETNEMRPLDWHDDQLTPLVGAINDCIAAAEQQVAEAVADAKRLAIELKLANGRRLHTEAVLNAMADAVLVTDPFDELRLANPAAIKMFGLPEGSVHRPVAELLEDRHLVEMIGETRQTRSPVPRVQEYIRDIAGERRAFRVTLRCVAEEADSVASGAGGSFADDRSAGVVAVLRDVTREQEVAQAKNDFVSAVSHELRTPLASINAYAEMLADGEAEDEKTRGEFCEIILGEAQRLGRMIDNILNISRIESGLVKINRKPLSPMVVAEEALSVIQPQAKLKNIEIRKHVLPAIYRAVADHDLLYQVMLNLLSNAVKYTPEGGTVTVTCSADEARGVVVTKVIDTGVGIPAADLPRLFEKFFRVEKNSKMAKGTGLGLPLVKRVIETDLGGKLIVESDEGKGSTFGFELPLFKALDRATETPGGVA